MFKTFRRLCSTSNLWTLESTLKETNIALRSTRDDTKLQFPLVWLRDNCQCPQCFNRTSKSRILDLSTNLKVRPVDVKLEHLTEIVRGSSKQVGHTASEETNNKTIDFREVNDTVENSKFKDNRTVRTKDNAANGIDNTQKRNNATQTTINSTTRGTNQNAIHETNNKTIVSTTESTIDKHEETPRTNKNNYKLNIKWEDGHESDFQLDWLLERNFSDTNRRILDLNYKMTQEAWRAEDFEKVCSRFDFDDVMQDERTLLKWLECLATYGVAVLQGAGEKVGSLKELAGRVGFLKKTQYGETFRVEAKPGTSNVAYLSSKLQLHTDLPYYEYKPGLNLLHCIVQSPAPAQGTNQLTDGLAVCHHLASKDRDVFKVLARTVVDWSDYGEDDRYKFANIHRSPVICLDATGRIARVNYSQPQRDSVFNVPLDEVQPWYDAMAEFTRLLHDRTYMVELKLRPGEVLTFDNVRLVHGRTGYDGERLLEGGYLDWDLVRSRIRVLRAELGEEDG